MLQATKAAKKSKTSSRKARRSVETASSDDDGGDVHVPIIDTIPLSDADLKYVASADPQALFNKAGNACQQGNTLLCLALFVAFSDRYPQFAEVCVVSDCRCRIHRVRVS